MGRYSIKDLENFTDIKAHTIRIWEQRYNLLSPERTESNIRFYSIEDVKKILNINLLYINGLKISKIAKLSNEEIINQAREVILAKSVSGNEEIDALLIAVTSMDANEIRRMINEYDDRFEMRELYSNVFVPLLIKMGKLWQTNSITVAHEHHFSNILRDFFILKIDRTVPKQLNGKKALLFLPEHEEHELSLLYFQYLLKESGFHCIYLGKNVPLKDLADSIAQTKPDLLVTNMITRIPRKEVGPFFKELLNCSSGVEIRIAGSFIAEITDQVPQEITLLQSEKGLIN